MGTPFLVLSIPRHLLKPLPFPSGINLQPGLCRSRGGLCLNSLASCPPLLYSLLSHSSASQSLDVLWWFIYLGALLRSDEMPGHLHSLVIAFLIPRPHSTQPCQRHSCRPDPYPPPSVLLIPFLSVDICGPWRYNSTESFDVIVDTTRLEEPQAITST